MLQYKFGTNNPKHLNDWLRGSQIVNVTSDNVLHIYGEHDDGQEFEVFIEWNGDESYLDFILFMMD